MTHRLRVLVEARANARCEYCGRYQEYFGAVFFEVEHITPRSLGGRTVPSNLAFSCRRCNLYKGSAIEALDPLRERVARLFHPRKDRWLDHFERSQDRLEILGRTAVGRATVVRLRLNHPDEMRVRELQRDYLADLFPLD